jgi:hypothetical protein
VVIAFFQAVMKLPHPRLATVEREKITEYLLNDAHPDNGGKALFFVALGFSREGWQTLANAFLKLALEAEVAIAIESSHGIKYIVDGALSTPSGKRPTVRTVWIVDKGSENPRLVTAYPLEGI